MDGRRSGRTWSEMDAHMGASGRKWTQRTQVDANGRILMQMDENGRKWMEVDVIGRKWTEMDGNGR